MTPGQLLVLKSEILLDPITLGYAALVAAGDLDGVATLLNDPTRGGSLNLASADADALRCSIVPSEYLSLTANERTYLNFLLGGERVFLTTVVKQWVNGLGASFSGSKTAMAAHFSRPGSRAEALLGEGMIVGHSDVSQALAS